MNALEIPTIEQAMKNALTRGEITLEVYTNWLNVYSVSDFTAINKTRYAVESLNDLSAAQYLTKVFTGMYIFAVTVAFILENTNNIRSIIASAIN